jgi:hypothetical protein
VNTPPKIVKRVYGYAYPRNGNFHNPTPRVAWDLFVNGKLVDSFPTKREALAAIASYK